MTTDEQVRRLMSLIEKGMRLCTAAAKSGMSELVARKYRRAGKLPGQMKAPRTWLTRPDPLEAAWPYVLELLGLRKTGSSLSKNAKVTPPPAEHGGKPLPDGDRVGRLGRFNEAPAENGGKRFDRSSAGTSATRFNEAPAENGGKPTDRPKSEPETPSFNEAPAENGGKPRRSAWMLRGMAGFNEAPAENGGKPEKNREHD